MTVDAQQEEFAYFRASGAALDAVLTIEANKQEIQDIQINLVQHFHAKGIAMKYDEDADDIYMHGFIFSDNNKIPNDWIKGAPFPAPDGNTHTLAGPARETESGKQVMSALERAHTLYQNLHLENRFVWNPKPNDAHIFLTKGNHCCTAFVRAKTDKATPVHNPTEEGFLADQVTDPTKTGDVIQPMDYKKIGNDWYIRIPKRNGYPTRILPDLGEPISLKSMLALENIEVLSALQSKKAASSQHTMN